MGHQATELTQFLIRHGYSVIFLWVLAEQAGIPLPSLPLLLSAGALSAEGKIDFQVLLLLTFGSVVGAGLPIGVALVGLGLGSAGIGVLAALLVKARKSSRAVSPDARPRMPAKVWLCHLRRI